MYPPLNKCGNAGRIAKWILGEIGDPLDRWRHGNGVASARTDIRLAIGDTVVTLENKWWGVRGSRVHLSSYVPTNPLQSLWNLRHVWAPVWLRESFSLSWGVTAARHHLRLHDPFYWSEDHASAKLMVTRLYKVY